MTFKTDFNRFAGLNTLPGLPAATEGVKDEAYREGLSAGDAVVQALLKGWAKTPKESTKKAWMVIVDKYAGMQEFSKDPDWTKGFKSALVGHYGKPIQIEATEGNELAEASEVGREQLPPYADHNVKLIEKLVGGKFETAWSGGIGIILVIKTQGTVRFTAKMLRDLQVPDFRWVEIEENSVSVGC